MNSTQQITENTETEQAVERIIEKLVPENERITFLSNKFKNSLESIQLFELNLYQMAMSQSKEYQGGYWHFVNLSNGGFYLYPDESDDFRFSVNSPNYFSANLSPKGFGVYLTMLMLNQLSWFFYDKNRPALSQRANELYYALQAYCYKDLKINLPLDVQKNEISNIVTLLD